MTKAEYVRIQPHSADFCWCCGGDWDKCDCGFYDTQIKCPDCGKGETCHCYCIRIGGNLARIGKAVRDGKMTVEEAQAEMAKCNVGQHAKWKKLRSGEAAFLPPGARRATELIVREKIRKQMFGHE